AIALRLPQSRDHKPSWPSLAASGAVRRPTPRAGSRHFEFGPSASFSDFEFFQRRLILREAEAGSFFIEIDVTLRRRRLALENIPEQLVANFDIDRREKFRHGRIQAGHHDVIIMHLAGVRNYGDGMRRGE